MSSKRRNIILTIVLWVAAVINLAITVGFIVELFNAKSSEMALGFGLCSMFALANILGVILLLRQRKCGFSLLCISAIFLTIIYVFVLQIEIASCIIFFGAIGLLWLLFQLRHERQSAWSLLQSGWDVKHCRHIYQIFAAVGIVLFIVTLVLFGQNQNIDGSKIKGDVTRTSEGHVIDSINEPMERQEKEKQNSKESNGRFRQMVSDNKENESNRRRQESPVERETTSIQDAAKYLDTHSVWHYSEMAQYPELKNLNKQIQISLHSGHCRISGSLCSYSKKLSELRRLLMEFERASKNKEGYDASKDLMKHFGSSDIVYPERILKDLRHSIIQLRKYEKSVKKGTPHRSIGGSDSTINERDARKKRKQKAIDDYEKMLSDSAAKAVPSFELR